MKKVWAIARFTYRQRIWSGSFLLLTFGLPILMVLAAAIPILQELGGEVGRLGFVDETGQMASVDHIFAGDESVEVITLDDMQEADRSWKRGEIDGYLRVPAGYFSSQQVEYYAAEEPGAVQKAALTSILRRGLLPGHEEYFYRRLDNPAQMEYVNLAGNQRLTEGLEIILQVATPVALGLMFALAVMTGTSQIGQVLAQEKDQRSMEMVITSVSPRELVAGKLAGMTLLTLTQVGIWVLSASIVLAIAFGDAFASGEIAIPWLALAWGALLGIPGYFTYAIAAAAIGVTAEDRQHAQQMAGMLGFLGLFPLWFMAPIVQAPEGPVAVTLTIFPLTAPIVGLFRMGISEVPTWQLLAGFGSLLIAGALGTWIVARIFRTMMLMYGQRLGLRQIMAAIRQV